MKMLSLLLTCWVLFVSPLLASYSLNDVVEVAYAGAWYKAKVIEVEAARWKISYDGYGSHWDEWVGADRLRRPAAAQVVPAPAVAPAPPAAAAAPSPAGLQTRVATDFPVGGVVEVLSSGKWYGAKVLEADTARGWKIHYDGYSDSWDEWVGRDRIRAPQAAAKQVERFPFPERPEGKTAGLEGAYLRVVSWYWNGRLSLTNEGWFFTKDGRFSQTPVGGLKLVALAKAETARKTDGVYWIEGDKLILRWASGAQDREHDFARDKDGVLKIGGIAAVPVAGFVRGWRTDASFEGGASASGSGTYVAFSNSLHLRSDGTFASGAVGSVSAATSSGTVGGGSTRDGAGTYEFDDYSLVLRHADGRVEERTVFAFGDKGEKDAPDYIWREGTMLRRRD